MVRSLHWDFGQYVARNKLSILTLHIPSTIVGQTGQASTRSLYDRLNNDPTRSWSDSLVLTLPFVALEAQMPRVSFSAPSCKWENEDQGRVGKPHSMLAGSQKAWGSVYPLQVCRLPSTPAILCLRSTVPNTGILFSEQKSLPPSPVRFNICFSAPLTKCQF